MQEEPPAMPEEPPAMHEEPPAMPQTLAEKVWERHVVHRADGEPDLLYVDLHLVHEVTSPQAFDGIRMHGRPVRRPDLTVATMDHKVPTTAGPVTDGISARRRPTVSTRRPRHGAPTAMPMVITAAAAPAAA